MSVNDEREFPWLVREKEFIRNAIQAGKPVLGICLGAQLIASAMGARVYPNRTREIGWFPVQGITPAGGNTFRFPPALEVWHWHGETFDLPPGAVQLARSESCENQAFQLGPAVIGLQFHLEVTPETIRAMLRHGQAELTPAPGIQSAAAMLAVLPEKYRAANNLMAGVLSFLG